MRIYLGPSMRYIFDFADPDNMEYYYCRRDESGNFMSDHYSDMTKMWLKGKYIKLPLTEEKFRNNAVDEIDIRIRNNFHE